MNLFHKSRNISFFYIEHVEGAADMRVSIKGSVREKNERGYRLNAIKKALSIATNLTSICCVYKEKIVKVVSYRRR